MVAEMILVMAGSLAVWEGKERQQREASGDRGRGQRPPLLVGESEQRHF